MFLVRAAVEVASLALGVRDPALLVSFTSFEDIKVIFYLALSVPLQLIGIKNRRGIDEALRNPTYNP